MAAEDEVVDIFSSTDLKALEALVFADDRLKYLDENFSKGDEAYWYYRILTLQKHFGSSLTAGAKSLASALDKVKKVENVKDSKNIADLLLRQAIINYERSTTPIKRQTLAKLKSLIGANLGTTQQGTLSETSTQQSENYPASLNLNTKSLLTKAWNQFNNIEKRNDLKEVFTAVASDFLANQKLNPQQTSEFLDLIESESPEVPYLLTYVKNDLKNGTEFGDKTIHFRLTKEHLELLKNTCPKSENYMRYYAWKLRRVTDVSYEHDLKAREQYLKSLKDFAEKTLQKNPKFNSLRALILFNWLTFAEEKGVYNKQVLKTYMKIPKNSQYCQELYANANNCASLDYDVDLIPELYPIIDDTPFIKRALRHVFQNFDDNLSKWKDVVDSNWLKKLYCEVKLMKGQGRTADLRRAYGKFGKYAFQELCQQVNIELLRSNKMYYSVNDAVNLTLLLKNVPELEIRIYQIDCKEYFLRFKDRVGLDIPLDGLSPNHVLNKTYEDPALSQRTRKIELRELQGRRGVFLIEFFGNGKKTRALIRKGELRYISQQALLSEFSDDNNDGGLGYQFRVFNEDNQPVLNPELYMNGKRYTAANENGDVFVPFAEEDMKRCPLIIEDIDNPGSATVHFFNHKTENYRLECGMFIDRESLLEKQQAQVILRPTLLLNEMPVSVDNLKNVQLTIETTDAQDFKAKHVVNVNFQDNAEAVETFVVPNELRCVKLSLTCEVFSLSQKSYLQLENDESFRINDIDKTNALADMHLVPRGSFGYVLAVLGKNGEPYKNVVVDIELSHRYFQEKLKYTLKTDTSGQIILGRLPDITTLEASASSELVYQGVDDETKHSWVLCHDQVNVPTTVNVSKGQVVRIPFMASDASPKVDVYDIDFVKKFTNVSYKNGYIEIKSLPGGQFLAFIRDTQEAEVFITVSNGDTFGNHVVTNNRIVELSEERPLQITEVQGNRTNGYRVQLMGHNDATRVHIFSTHLVPRFSCYSFLASPEIPPSVVEYVAYPGLYGDMESVSKEFQYIANRKNANKYSGNLLERPTLLTKRWTTAGPTKQRLPPDETFMEEAHIVDEDATVAARDVKYDPYLTKIQFDSSNLEFLAQPSLVHVNLPVDANGSVLILPEYLSNDHNILQIIAVDEDNTCLRNVMLQDEGQQAYRDVRLNNVLNPEVHWTERREILELREPGSSLFIQNFVTSDIETYDDLSDVFELYVTLSGIDQLKSFKFLTRWVELDMEKKLEYYDRYQSAEVNFYLFNKDGEFFETVVQPLLRSKVQKDFMDLYLLGDDVSSYVSVIKYQSLNTLERILLASRITDLADPTLKYLSDSVSGLAEVPQESDELFQAALESKQLAADTSDSWQKRRYTEAPMPLEKVGDVIDQTREYQETRYYKVPFEQQSSDLVPASRFWLDYAKYLLTGESEHFLSKQFHTPTKNLTQMLLALSVIDLPFRSQVVDPTMDFISGSNGATMTVQSPTIVLSRQIKESVVQTSALAVSTNYFDPEEPFEYVDFERQDKFLTMPLLTQKVYGCRVVITNVSSMTHTVELLSQIPEGSIPVYDGFRTKNTVEELEPYTTKHREFYFYFPSPGAFTHYQTRVSKNGKVIGFGKEDPNVVVVDPEDVVDTTSWEYFSRKASNSELLEHLQTSSDVHKVDLNKIAWRMEDEEMFMSVTAILRDRQIYSESIWAYSMKYYSFNEVKEYLSMQPKFLELISPDLSSSVITDYDAFGRQVFQVMEYWPLNAPRAHYHEFNNDFFQAQYLKYLKRTFYRSSSVESMPPADQMVGVYYFLIQNRVEDALRLFEKIVEEDAREISAFTYDYLRAYLAFYSQDHNEITNAATLCENYLGQTLTPSKSSLWQGVLDYLNELKQPSFSDNLFDPTTEADIRSARAKKLDCEVNDDRTITITYKNVDSVEINFYQTDIELQFSTAPFRQESNAFNFVAPTDSVVADLDPTERSATIDLPTSLHDKSSVVEVIGGGMTVSRANYDNHLKIEISQKLRQIRVFNSTTNAAIAKAYVKVYCQTPDAPDGRFLKDGYTDLRGRFDYATVSTDEMKFVTALAILVLTDSAGSDVLEVGV